MLAPAHTAGLAQRGELQFEADTKQQEQHSEVGNQINSVGGVIPKGMENKTGSQITDQRRQLYGVGCESEYERNQNQGQIHGQQRLPSVGGESNWLRDECTLGSCIGHSLAQ